MFEYILGIPAHPLFVHFAIVFLVLLVTGAAIYALVPPLRRASWWAVAGLAVAGPVGAYFAKESGEKLFDMLVAKSYPKEIMDQVNTHLAYGDTTFNFSLGLGAATLLLVFVSIFGDRMAPAGKTRRGSLYATIVLSLAVLVLAGFTGYYAFKTGDTGSHIVWGSFAKP